MKYFEHVAENFTKEKRILSYATKEFLEDSYYEAFRALRDTLEGHGLHLETLPTLNFIFTHHDSISMSCKIVLKQYKYYQKMLQIPDAIVDHKGNIQYTFRYEKPPLGVTIEVLYPLPKEDLELLVAIGALSVEQPPFYSVSC